MKSHLRIFTGDDEATAIAEPKMTVTLGEISDILADAVLSRRAWLSDFQQDQVQISPDLYEVLTTYWRLKPGA
ncbi:MAG: hypothetical protein KDA68_18570 [Planctomycetaceae bacterium]|nr:hypothetical protein [Planctomycetaceae bacterium]